MSKSQSSLNKQLISLTPDAIVNLYEIDFSILQENFEQLNEACICGFYINTSQLDVFENHQFYIPSKLDWFLEPHENVDWKELSNFQSESQIFIINWCFYRICFYFNIIKFFK